MTATPELGVKVSVLLVCSTGIYSQPYKSLTRMFCALFPHATLVQDACVPPISASLSILNVLDAPCRFSYHALQSPVPSSGMSRFTTVVLNKSDNALESLESSTCGTAVGTTPLFLLRAAQALPQLVGSHNFSMVVAVSVVVSTVVAEPVHAVTV